MDKVSIITPVYKVERYIQECVESVLSQTYQNIEFILVDDCGGDKSIEIAEQILKENKHTGFIYQILHHDHNRGVSAARNTALTAATGNYIFCLDSDDKLENNAIEKLMQKASETDADIVVCAHHSDGINANLGGKLHAPIAIAEGREECFKALANCWFNVAPWCKLIKYDLIRENNIYFYTDIINEDVLWTFCLCAYSKNIAFLHEELYFYRYNNISIMWHTKKDKIIRSNRIICEQMVKIIQEIKLYNNIYVYKNYMNVFNTYLNRTIRYKGYKGIKAEKINWSLYKYSSTYFSLSSYHIPFTYKLLNAIFYLPYFARELYIYMIQRLLNKKL